MLLLLLLLFIIIIIIINSYNKLFVYTQQQSRFVPGGCENTWHMEIYIVILLKVSQVFNSLFLMVFVLLKTQSNENSASQVLNKGAKVLPILLNFQMTPPPLPPFRVTSLGQTTDVQTIDE